MYHNFVISPDFFLIVKKVQSGKKYGRSDQSLLVFGLHQKQPTVTDPMTRFHNESNEAEALPECCGYPFEVGARQKFWENVSRGQKTFPAPALNH